MTIPIWLLIAGGVKSWLVAPPVGTGGTVSARYCYSVFLRHRILAARHGLAGTPRTVVELGPGDSLGIGLMALLTGSESFVAVDAVRHASPAENVRVLGELIAMLRDRAPIPGDGDCAEVRPLLDDLSFPAQILDPAAIERALASDRIEAIRGNLEAEADGGIVRYLAPFGELRIVGNGSVDWVFSQAVLEHVDDLESAYGECFRCLRPGGLMTHQVDFRSHETAPEWNGHWKYPGWLWRLMRGARPWFLNRVPHSRHRQLQEAAGFRILGDSPQRLEGGISRAQLARDFGALSDDDLGTAGAFFVSMRPAS